MVGIGASTKPDFGRCKIGDAKTGPDFFQIFAAGSPSRFAEPRDTAQAIAFIEFGDLPAGSSRKVRGLTKGQQNYRLNGLGDVNAKRIELGGLRSK